MPYLSQITNWFKTLKVTKENRLENISKTITDLVSSDSPVIKKIINDPDLKKAFFTQDVLDSDEFSKVVKNNKTAKSPTEIFLNFFGMNENWPIWRSMLGGALVHSPEYPTYFIPAYTQAKATGDAGELKKGEGPRGLITGGLEGLAVGALVSGKNLKPREMVPYVILGAGLQYISSKFFPWLGEKWGRAIYLRNLSKNGQSKITPPETVQKTLDTVSEAPATAVKNPKTQISKSVVITSLLPVANNQNQAAGLKI